MRVKYIRDKRSGCVRGVSKLGNFWVPVFSASKRDSENIERRGFTVKNAPEAAVKVWVSGKKFKRRQCEAFIPHRSVREEWEREKRKERGY